LAGREADTEPKPQKAQRRGFTQICGKETDIYNWSDVAEAPLTLHCAAAMELEPLTYERPASNICKTHVKPIENSVMLEQIELT
jgi:hypothetical protein